MSDRDRHGQVDWKTRSWRFHLCPAIVPHQEINASTDETLECFLVRSGNEAIVVNLDIEPVKRPEEVRWIDPIHRHG
jgi:uncharacterized RmlC-like cupin family protein